MKCSSEVDLCQCTFDQPGFRAFDTKIVVEGATQTHSGNGHLQCVALHLGMQERVSAFQNGRLEAVCPLT